MIFWGPPGCGKTTLARLIGKHSKLRFYELSAVFSGLKDVRALVDRARDSKPIVLFIDEIHRFNKAQQDAFLPHVENGGIIFLGATTENPGFSINRSLLSRCHLIPLPPLQSAGLGAVLERALEQSGCQTDSGTQAVIELIASSTGGDARRALSTLEMLLQSSGAQPLTKEKAIQFLEETKTYSYDKNADLHFELLSAFIKSMRASDADAALYYAFRILQGGGDPQVLLRRMIIFASEDIGNADPRAFSLAGAVAQAFDRIGLPEAEIPIAQCICYLSTAPKSNRSYIALKRAKECVQRHPDLRVPPHLRNAPTAVNRMMGDGVDYQYPHDVVDEPLRSCKPAAIENDVFYEPSSKGYEARIRRDASDKGLNEG
jgi:putative ATPase